MAVIADNGARSATQPVPIRICHTKTRITHYQRVFREPFAFHCPASLRVDPEPSFLCETFRDSFDETIIVRSLISRRARMDRN